MRSLTTYVHGTVFLTFLITTTSSDQFGVHSLAKLFFYLEILTWSPTLNLGSLSSTSLLACYSIEWIYVLSSTSAGFILIVLWYILLYSFTTSFNLSIYTFFDIEVMTLQILVFKFLIDLSATTYFPSLCIEHISISLFFNHFLTKLL